MTIDAGGNYVYAPGKVVALVGVHNLVVVETDDALLITTRDGRRMWARWLRAAASRAGT